MAQAIKQPQQKINFLYNSNNSMFLKPLTANELIKHINDLKNNCSSGMDGITTKIIKTIHLHLLEPLMHIINLIFKTGKIPEKFKESIVIPIYKNSGNKEEISNYRPISLINNLGKIIEKCIKDRLINFLSSNNILSENQFGFAEGRSTADAMYELIKEVTNELDSSSKTIAVFLDLARAFDTVSHLVLFDILFSYGVGGTVLDVFRNYLNINSICES